MERTELSERGMKITVEPKTCEAVQCLEENCRWNRVCANHVSAGDFRTEGGSIPLLTLKNGEMFCDTIHSPGNGYEYHEEPINTDVRPPRKADQYWESNCVLWKDLVEETNTYEI